MGGRFSDNLNFNCTIQELKQVLRTKYEIERQNFNCTIQELKQLTHYSVIEYTEQFQLHHTGIKTP